MTENERRAFAYRLAQLPCGDKELPAGQADPHLFARVDGSAGAQLHEEQPLGGIPTQPVPTALCKPVSCHTEPISR